MKTALYIDFEHNRIVMTSTFAKRCYDTSSVQYAQLQNVRRDYPTFHVEKRQIKKNASMEHYKGLTYEYMESYIKTHGEEDERIARLDEFREMCLISECHSIRYPKIKKWFLDKYPEIVEYGMPEKEEEKPETNVMPMKEAA